MTPTLPTCHPYRRPVVTQRRSRCTGTLLRRQIRRSRQLKLPSQRSFNWTGSPPFHRSFVLRGLLPSPGSSRRLDFLTESQSYRPSPLYWCRSPLSLCHLRAIRCGQQTSSLLHPSFTRFVRMSWISIHSQGAGQVAPSITFTILSRARN
jgi:hypothetical protein